MVEGPSKNDRLALSGRTDGFKLVNFRLPESCFLSGDDLAGKTVDIRITDAKTFSLFGEIV